MRHDETLNAAIAALLTSDVSQARAILHSGLEAGEESPDALCLLAACALLEDNESDALDLLRWSVELGLPSILKCEAVTYLLNGLADQAARDLLTKLQHCYFQIVPLTPAAEESLPFKLTTLREVCAKQGSHFQEIRFGDLSQVNTLREFGQVVTRQLQFPYICVGLVSNVHIFGRSFIHTEDQECVFYGQSYQNNKGIPGLADAAKLFIDGNKTNLFETYLEDECIFLGGNWTEATPKGLSHLAYSVNFGQFIFEYLTRIALFDLLGLSSRLPIVVYK
jgi:hypothetical protein